MEFKIEFDNVDKIIQRLYKVDDLAFEKCVEVMQDLVRKLKAEAVKRVPVDEGILEKSFSTKIIEAASRDAVIGEVFIAANAMAADYALWIHEGDYNLGERSRAKQSASDVTVGRKYLERALNENERAFGLYLYSKLKEYLN